MCYQRVSNGKFFFIVGSMFMFSFLLVDARWLFSPALSVPPLKPLHIKWRFTSKNIELFVVYFKFHYRIFSRQQYKNKDFDPDNFFNHTFASEEFLRSII